jgi:RimJ/RimL family protein N-acetyltransferase
MMLTIFMRVSILNRSIFLRVFYSRVEWKCDALNTRSRAAAERLGFQFEGIFRQHMLVKGKNRDTAWYSIIDSEWPTTKTMLQQKLNKTYC